MQSFSILQKIIFVKSCYINTNISIISKFLITILIVDPPIWPVTQEKWPASTFNLTLMLFLTDS